jgi:hypothetical protein
MRKPLMTAVIGAAVMFVVIACAVIAPPKEPTWVVMSRAISEESLAVGELAESMALALYEADQKTAAQAATSIIGHVNPYTGEAPDCLANVVIAQSNYYELLGESSKLVIAAIKGKDWDQLIPVGELLLQAEDASIRLYEEVLAINPAACD